jgi:hypothetical protein
MSTILSFQFTIIVYSVFLRFSFPRVNAFLNLLERHDERRKARRKKFQKIKFHFKKLRKS